MLLFKKKHQTRSYKIVLHLDKVLREMFKFNLAVDDQELIFNFIAFHERSSFSLEIRIFF